LVRAIGRTDGRDPERGGDGARPRRAARRGRRALIGRGARRAPPLSRSEARLPGAAAEAKGTVLALDHLVLCARTLEEGARWVRARAGVDVSPGGRHEGFGTHNALLRLGDDVYLEVLASDPAQPEAPRGRLFGLGEQATAALLAGGPALLHWVLRSSDLAADVARLAAGAGVSPGAIGIPTAMRRGDLAWTLTVRDDRARPPAGLPSVIDWGAAPHPCTRLPDAGVRLAGLAVAGPAATVAALAPLASSDARLSFTVGDVPRLAADLRAG
jgi:glyoxalase-like protein